MQPASFKGHLILDSMDDNKDKIDELLFTESGFQDDRPLDERRRMPGPLLSRSFARRVAQPSSVAHTRDGENC